MKKLLVLTIVAAALVLAGCTVVMKMRVNGERKFHVTADCGRMEITCGAINGHWLRMQVRVTEGEFEFYPGNLTMTTDSGERLIPDWYTGTTTGEKVTDGRIMLRKGDVAGFSHSFWEADFSPVDKERYITVDPGNSVMCNGKPVFTGTLKLQRKGKK